MASAGHDCMHQLSRAKYSLACESATVQPQPAWLDQPRRWYAAPDVLAQCWQAMHNMVMHVVTLVCDCYLRASWASHWMFRQTAAANPLQVMWPC
jgi:hypothetical protein